MQDNRENKDNPKNKVNPQNHKWCTWKKVKKAKSWIGMFLTNNNKATIHNSNTARATIAPNNNTVITSRWMLHITQKWAIMEEAIMVGEEDIFH